MKVIKDYSILEAPHHNLHWRNGLPRHPNLPWYDNIPQTTAATPHNPPPATNNPHNQSKMSDDHGTQQDGRLLKLPSEIRIIIHGLVFPPGGNGLYVTVEPDRWVRRHNHRTPALLATCRTIYSEAKSVLYENTEFQISCSYNLPIAEDSKDAFWEGSLSDESTSEEESSDDPPAVKSSAEDSGYVEAILKAKPLIEQMRKLLVRILLPDDYFWLDSEDKNRWYQNLTFEITSLSEAPNLKKIHIEFDVCGGTEVAGAFDRIMRLLSRAMCRIAPTISIGPSLQRTDFEPLIYHDTLARLAWVDTTIEQHSTKLADLSNKRSRIVRKIRDRSKWAAAKSAGYRDIVNNDDFFNEGSDLQEQARFIPYDVEQGFKEILAWTNKLRSLKEEIASTEEYLGWISEKRVAPAEIEPAIVGEL